MTSSDERANSGVVYVEPVAVNEITWVALARFALKFFVGTWSAACMPVSAPVKVGRSYSYRLYATPGVSPCTVAASVIIMACGLVLLTQKGELSQLGGVPPM